MVDVDVKDANGTRLHTYTIHIDSDVYGTLIGDDVVCATARMYAIDDGLVSEEDADTFTYTVAT